MIDRQSHLKTRQVIGRAFSEPLQILRTSGTRNAYGEYSETETSEDTVCSTAPLSRSDSRVRERMEGGVQLDDMRLFWTVEELNPAILESSSGDILVWNGQRYRVKMTQRWGDFSESLAERQEGQ